MKVNHCTAALCVFMLFVSNSFAGVLDIGYQSQAIMIAAPTDGTYTEVRWNSGSSGTPTPTEAPGFIGYRGRNAVFVNETVTQTPVLPTPTFNNETPTESPTSIPDTPIPPMDTPTPVPSDPTDTPIPPRPSVTPFPPVTPYVESYVNVPGIIGYQGRVMVNDAPFNGTGYFKFALVTETGDILWSNDGSFGTDAEPVDAVPLAVNEGLFSVGLGDTSVDKMDYPITSNLFENPEIYLRVWFSSDGENFDQLSSDQRIPAVGYAMKAERAGKADYAGIADSADRAGNAFIAEHAYSANHAYNAEHASTADDAFNAGNAYYAGNAFFADVAYSLDGFDPDSVWKLNGNAGTTPGTDFIGTTDDQALILKANSQRVMRLEPNPTCPNIIGGSSSNRVAQGVKGAFIGGGGFPGYFNQVKADFGAISGGIGNIAGKSSFVGSGDRNTASGVCSTVAGGFLNTAQGDFSFAAGLRAKALHDGSFVWGDSSPADIASTAEKQFIARSSGGVYFYSNSAATTGVELTAGGGSWTSVSDRNMKENFAPIDGDEILSKLDLMPITEYNLITQEDSIIHIGPISQDFAAIFGYGEHNNRRINNLDAIGVSLAANQANYRLLKETIKEKDTEIEELKKRLSELEALVQSLVSAQEK